MGGVSAWARLGAIVALCLAGTCHGRRVEFRRSLLAPATATATTSAVSLDLAYISGNLTNITADVNTTAASIAICQIADSNSSTAVQTIAQGFAATLINGTHGNATGEALSMALANTTNTTQQNVAQGYATAILAFYAANYTKVCSIHQNFCCAPDILPDTCWCQCSLSAAKPSAVLRSTLCKPDIFAFHRQLQKLLEHLWRWVRQAWSRQLMQQPSAPPTTAR